MNPASFALLDTNSSGVAVSQLSAKNGDAMVNLRDINASTNNLQIN